MITNTNEPGVLMETEHYVLERHREPNVEFFGERIATASSRTPDSVRWTEINIYRTDRGRYVTEMLGHSSQAGERTIRTVHVFREPEEVPLGLRITAEGREFLTNLARGALELAAQTEPRIWNGNEQV